MRQDQETNLQADQMMLLQQMYERGEISDDQLAQFQMQYQQPQKARKKKKKKGRPKTAVS